MPEQTLGQKRVRHSFNPSSNLDVDNIKSRTADLIDLCEELRNKNNPKSISGEEARLWSLAQTHYEDAAMWAVKAATIGA
jgi:hypothetical protein